MDRRRFLLTSLAGALALPLAAEAQQDRKVYRIGYLATTPEATEWGRAFVDRLRELGYVEGRNILIERRYSEGRPERFPGFVDELLDLNVDLILTVSAPETSAARRATRSTPIVFLAHGDPVGTGDVESLARPGGNVTGFTEAHHELSAKQLDLIKQLVPGLSRVVVLWNPTNPAKAGDWRALQSAGQALGLSVQSGEVRRSSDLQAVFAAIRRQRPGALVVLADPLTYTLRSAITQFAMNERLPAIYQLRGFAEAGGLISYAGDRADSHRRAATYVDQILRGARPADLPVQQPAKFDLVINLKTAKALGLTIPPSLLARADEVIE
jgi:putative ABC transport system substrate-binding protein